ncbi:hypothetical protein AURDEDRAFT_183819 [Auricularia subglabra TFB-10046 SS5]|nr:hypothetical protein AURDEDRAFT_183819 [Auricularia subglabra TFB-10046 SS5]
MSSDSNVEDLCALARPLFQLCINPDPSESLSFDEGLRIYKIFVQLGPAAVEPPPPDAQDLVQTLRHAFECNVQSLQGEPAFLRQVQERHHSRRLRRERPQPRQLRVRP